MDKWEALKNYLRQQGILMDESLLKLQFEARDNVYYVILRKMAELERTETEVMSGL